MPVPPHTKPLIGAINGPAVTGGLEVALACDFLVASERARFADTHARVGVVPGWRMSVVLPEAIGYRRAKEMSATGNFVDAETALTWGLVNHVVPHDELLPFCQRLGSDIASNDAETAREIFSIYNEEAELIDGPRDDRARPVPRVARRREERRGRDRAPPRRNRRSRPGADPLTPFAGAGRFPAMSDAADHDHVIDTGKGEFALSELGHLMPGMAEIMPLVGGRIWKCYYAGKAQNKPLARFQLSEAVNLMEKGAFLRPKYAENMEKFLTGDVAAVSKAIESEDWDAFETAFVEMVGAANAYHEIYDKEFLRWKIPSEPPPDLDFTPRA